MDKIIMWIMAVCALIGGLDRILGNRFGLGKRFEAAFHLMGPTALSMAGIICLVPLISRLLSGGISALCAPLGLDPAVLGGLLAIDMGGYQLAQELAVDPRIGDFSGIVVSAILGCTISFTIPVGMGMLEGEARLDFARGMLYGLISVPAGLLVGGLLCGLSLIQTLLQSLPFLLLAAIVLLGIWKNPDFTVRCFSIFSRIIFFFTTIGLMLGAFEYMSGIALLPGLAPLTEGMAVAASIAIVMMGSLPFAEILQRMLKRPLAWFGRRTGMNSASAAGLLVGMMSVLPAVALVRDMDRRGRTVIAAFMVCAASAFAAHLGFTAGVNPEMLLPLLASKLTGGFAGACIALYATRKAG